MEQRLLLCWAQNQIVMVVTDRQVDRSVVSPCDLGHTDRFEIVILGSFYIRCPQRDISELKYLRFEFLLHSLLPFVLLHSLLLFRSSDDPLPLYAENPAVEFDNIATFEKLWRLHPRPHALGRAGGNDVAGQQGHELT